MSSCGIWALADGLESHDGTETEGHGDSFAFEENFGSSVADGLEWGKSRGRQTITKFREEL